MEHTDVYGGYSEIPVLLVTLSSSERNLLCLGSNAATRGLSCVHTTFLGGDGGEGCGWQSIGLFPFLPVVPGCVTLHVSGDRWGTMLKEQGEFSTCEGDGGLSGAQTSALGWLGGRDLGSLAAD